VENLHEPGVGSKPLPVIIPVPLTARNPLPCLMMVDAVRLNVNPPTLQRPASPEPKFQGAAIGTGAPTLMAEKLPDRLATVGFAPLPLSHPVTLVAALAEVVSSSAPPLIAMEPVIGAASSVMPAPSRATAATSVHLLVLFIFIFFSFAQFVCFVGRKIFAGTNHEYPLLN
jgi:hypothetical protein